MSDWTFCTFILPKDKSLKRMKRIIDHHYGGYNPVSIREVDRSRRLYRMTIAGYSLRECVSILELLTKEFSLHITIEEGYW